MTSDPSSELTVTPLSDRECRMRLATSEVGRLVFQQRGLVHVLPVNYAADLSHTIVFRSARGAKVDHARHERRPVAFQIGETTPDGTAWWVTAVGTLEEVLDLTDTPALFRMEIDPWADAVRRPHWLRLRPSRITGGSVTLARAEGVAPLAPADQPGAARDRGGLSMLPADEARRLVLSAPVGRLAYVRRREPRLVPVRAIGWDSRLLLSPLESDRGPAVGERVAYEVDGWDATQRTGWSVVVHGTVADVDAGSGVARVVPEIVDGRRIVRPRPSTARASLASSSPTTATDL